MWVDDGTWGYEIREWYLCLLKWFLFLIFIDYFTQFLHIIICMGRNAITFLGRIFGTKNHSNSTKTRLDATLKITLNWHFVNQLLPNITKLLDIHRFSCIMQNINQYKLRINLTYTINWVLETNTGTLLWVTLLFIFL